MTIMWSWKLYFNCCILIGLGFNAYLGASLECFKCAMNKPCTDLDIAERPGAILREVCVGHDVCSKNVVMDKKFGQDGTFIITRKYINRGCAPFDPLQDSLGCFWVWRKDEHTQQALRCLCNDTNYCNGVQAAISSVSVHMLGLSAIMVVILSV